MLKRSLKIQEVSLIFLRIGMYIMPLIYLAVANTEHGVNNENNIRHFLRPSLCQVLCSGLHLFKCKILGMHDILYLLERD